MELEYGGGEMSTATSAIRVIHSAPRYPLLEESRSGAIGESDGRSDLFGISRIWDEVMSALLYRKDLLVLYRDTLHS